MKPPPAAPTFPPATREEAIRLGWDRLDVILVTGDAYIDSPFIGTAVIARVLMDAGYRVGVIAQPDTVSSRDITRMGEPRLFWGVSAGCLDSMVANTTASGKRRKQDDLTPGGVNNRRPDRAVISYANLIRRHFKQTRPIVLGGIEASLRRISHYDAWSDAVRRSILFDARADLLAYGMAEETVLEVAAALRGGADAAGDAVRGIRGVCYISRGIPDPVPAFPGQDAALPDHADASRDKDAFTRMFRRFYENADPFTARRLYQKQDTRYLVQNPPPFPLSPEALDRVHELPYARDVHPFHRQDGPVTATDTIRFALSTHRGCFGECRFCAISVHQGRHVVSRSETSILREAQSFTAHPEFKGIIPDVGGPTANMYGIECRKKQAEGACSDRSCLFPAVCRTMPVRHDRQIRLLERLRALPGIRRVFIASGIRYDLILSDRKHGERYLTEILRHHVSGQLKIAPEHVTDSVLRGMGKPGREALEEFIRRFDRLKRENGLNLFLTYYFMAAHPGCTQADMGELRAFAEKRLRLLPEQTQIFTPTPATWSTLMYHTEKDPFTGAGIFVEKNRAAKDRQKAAVSPAGEARLKRRGR
ncbi:YgiQ family radical SAM protein [Desulfococcus sp.]|uniref:YgiQ family radical SAM protein n=1 Tax=Desulfococcus sp. TaxID=2025834 RepID=UPI00359437F0